jgi:hypothetical protein
MKAPLALGFFFICDVSAPTRRATDRSGLVTTPALGWAARMTVTSLEKNRSACCARNIADLSELV